MDSATFENVYGVRDHPYFIYAPRWIDSSAGIKALHYLCHSINKSGKKAFLIFTEELFMGQPRVNPELFTPVLTQEISDAYFEANITPIIIYSEMILNNPLNATCVVRYLMNYAGALGGARSFDELEFVVAFSENIAKKYAVTNMVDQPTVLFLPPIDPREFKKSSNKEPYQVIYAGKYRSFVGKPFEVGNLPTVEIFRDGPRMQTREQVRSILSKASIVYSFENSSIVSEAILSGTPAKFVENEFLGELIAEKELGNGGIVQGDTEAAFTAAKESLDEGITQYHRQVGFFLESLNEFISSTQIFAARIGYSQPLVIPFHNQLVSKHRISLAYQILKNHGLLGLFRVVIRFFLRRAKWKYWAQKKYSRNDLF